MNTWEDLERDARIVEKTTDEQAHEVVQLLKDAIGLFTDAFSVTNSTDNSYAAIAKMSLLNPRPTIFLRKKTNTADILRLNIML